LPRVITQRLILALLFWLVAEMTFLRAFHVGGAMPLPLYLMVLYACLEWGWKTTIPVAFCAGICRDFVGSSPFGVETSALVISSLVLDLLVQKIEHSFMVFRMAIALIFLTCAMGLNYSFTLVFGARTGFESSDFGVLFGSALYTALLYPVFFSLMSRWFKDRRVFKQYELF